MKEHATLAVGAVDDIVLWAHTAPIPDPADWQSALEFVTGLDSIRALIVYSGEASLNAGQRQDMSGLYEKYKMEMCVLTDSRMARGVLTALKWFGVKSRAFPPHDLEGVVKHIGREDLLDQIRAELTPFLS